MAGSWKGGGTCIARLVSMADIPKDLRKQILVDERTEKVYIFREGDRIPDTLQDNSIDLTGGDGRA